MPHHRSIAGQLNGIGTLPDAAGCAYHWALVANAALAEVMRGLWGGTHRSRGRKRLRLDSLERGPRVAVRRRSLGLARRSVGIWPRMWRRGVRHFHRRRRRRRLPEQLPDVVHCRQRGRGSGSPRSWAGGDQPYVHWGTTAQTFALAERGGLRPGRAARLLKEALPGSEFYQDPALVVPCPVTTCTPEQVAIRASGRTAPAPSPARATRWRSRTRSWIQAGANLEVAAETYARVGIANADAVTAAVVGQIPLQPDSPGDVYPACHRSELRDGPADAAIPRIHVGALDAVRGRRGIARVSVRGSFRFTDHAHDADGFAPRSFDRIYEAAEEAGISRIYAGIHFPSGNLDGQARGGA